MQFLYDFLPIVIFFIAYKTFDIYVATVATIAVYTLFIGVTFAKGKKPEPSQLISLALIVLLGGATVLFKNEWFIKWKPTAVYWLFSLIIFGSHFFGEKTILQRLLGKNLQLSRLVWQKINASWGGFFAIMGGLNLYVAYHFTTDVWVNFKLFGTLGLTLAFSCAQAFYLSKHLHVFKKEACNDES